MNLKKTKMRFRLERVMDSFHFGRSNNKSISTRQKKGKGDLDKKEVISSPKKTNRVSFTSSDFSDPNPYPIILSPSGISLTEDINLHSSSVENMSTLIEPSIEPLQKKESKVSSGKQETEDVIPVDKFLIELQNFYSKFVNSNDKKDLLKFRLEDMRDKAIAKLTELFNGTIQSQKEYIEKKKRHFEKQYEKQLTMEIPITSIKICSLCNRSEIFHSLFFPKECNHPICYKCVLPLVSFQVQSFIPINDGEKTKQKNPQYICPVTTCKKVIPFPLGSSK